MNTTEIEESKILKLVMESDVLNTEAVMYLYKNKISNKDYELLKYYYNSTGKYFSNKMFTIHQLITNHDEILEYIPNLVLPEKIATQNNIIVGYIMKYYQSKNLSHVLTDLNISKSERISYLTEVGEVLESLKTLRENSSISEMYLNDVHEDNFIITNTGKMHVVDIDSCKIENNIPLAAKYLVGSIEGLHLAPNKYDKDENEFGTIFKANEQSDLYCYLIMILNFLYGERRVHRMSLEEYYDYIDYLSKIGLSSDLKYAFMNLFSKVENENPKDLLKGLEQVYPRSTVHVYNRVRNKL